MNNADAAIVAATVNDVESPYSFHNVFQQVVACTKKNHISEAEFFRSLPLKKFPWYSHSQFSESYDAAASGQILEGSIVQQLAEVILEAAKSFSVKKRKKDKKLEVVDTQDNIIDASLTTISEISSAFFQMVAVEVEEPPIDPNYLRYNEFENLISKYEADKRVPFKNIEPLLPKQFKADFKQFHWAQNNVEKRAQLAVPFEFVSCVMSIYDGLPCPSDPALVEHITIENSCDNQLFLQMSASTAKDQITSAMASFKKSPKRLISDMVAMGYPARSVQLLVEGKTGEFVSRRLVAATLQHMGAYEVNVPEHSMTDIKQDYLPKGVMDVRKITADLQCIFNDLHGGTKMDVAEIYGYMLPEYQEAIELKAVKGWFNGRVTLARKDVVSMFMSAVIAKLEDANENASSDQDQTCQLNYQPTLHPVQLRRQ